MAKRIVSRPSVYNSELTMQLQMNFNSVHKINLRSITTANGTNEQMFGFLVSLSVFCFIECETMCADAHCASKQLFVIFLQHHSVHNRVKRHDSHVDQSIAKYITIFVSFDSIKSFVFDCDAEFKW